MPHTVAVNNLPQSKHQPLRRNWTKSYLNINGITLVFILFEFEVVTFKTLRKFVKACQLYFILISLSRKLYGFF